MIDNKKTPKADLERKKFFFVEIGMILTLAVIFVAFEWKSYERQEVETAARQVQTVQEEMVEITKQEKPPTPPQTLPQTTIIHIVENDMEINDDIEINAEADQNTKMEEYVQQDIEVKDEEDAGEMEIFTVVEAMPEFPGGDEARVRFLQENLKYPQAAKEAGIEGRVYLTFVVEKDGRVTDVKVLRGIGGGCDEEAIRVVQAMPKWKAGMQRNRPVRVQYNMPILFKLN